MYKIVLAEDHVLVREGIKKIIEALPGLQVVGEVGDGPQLLELLKGLAAGYGDPRYLHAFSPGDRSHPGD